MSFHDIRILYLHELRSALRERGIVVNSILIPLFLYPLMMWLMLSAFSFVRGQQERFVSRVALIELPAAHDDLRQRLAASERDDQGDEDTQIELVDLPEDWDRAITEGELDTVAEFLPPEAGGDALADNFRLRLSFDASRDRSVTARERLVATVDAYREAWLERAGGELGLGPEELERFCIERHNVASGAEMGAFIVGLMVPMLMIIMIAMGCLYPAVDSTAGERERSTWETLMTVSASRTSIVVAKYLYVATLGGFAGLLNLFAMTLSMSAIVAPMMAGGDLDLEFQIPFAALPLMALSAVLLAMFIAAGMMLFAAFARTFKEGQTMVSPLLMLTILPTLLVQSPDLELTPKLALVPIANVALMFREAIAGVYNWPMIGLTLAVQVAAVALCLTLARYVLGFEDVLLGSYSGSLPKFVKQRMLRGSKSGGAR